jgi:hypothetical protein
MDDGIGGAVTLTRRRGRAPSAALTRRQAEALRAVRDFGARHGRMPSHRELSRALRPATSRQTADRLLKSLVAAGALELAAGGGRLTRAAADNLRLRGLLGDVLGFLRGLDYLANGHRADRDDLRRRLAAELA